MASCEVSPAGLSSSRTPSIRGLLGRQVSVLDLREERLDPSGTGDRVVRLELDVRCDPQAQGAADANLQVARETREALERLLSLGVGAEHADEDLRVAKVAREVDTSDGDEAGD